MITNIRLQNFRSYTDASFEFEPGVNIIVGPNASGKTNILEAILMLSQGKSYRAKDNEMVRHEAPWARIDADIGPKQRVVKLENLGDIIKKTFTIEDNSVSRLQGAKQIPVVFFEPNHLLILNGSPELRRAFLDNLIEQIDPQYGTTINKYKRTLLQRNKLLKTGGQMAVSQLFAWDIRLSEFAEQIVIARHQMIAQINERLSDVYSQIAHKPSQLTLAYSNPVNPDNYASYLLKKLEKEQQLDLLRGFTAAGPHREDILFELNGKALSTTASRGEARTTLLAVKVIELQIIEAAKGQKPLVLLDDVFSELDGARRHALTDHLKSHQTFITTTDADLITQHFTQKSNVIAL